MILKLLAAWFDVSFLLVALYAAAPRAVGFVIVVLTVLVAVLMMPFVLIGSFVERRL